MLRHSMSTTVSHLIAPLLSSVLILSGCSSVPPLPTDKMSNVRSSVQAAREKEAQTHAAVELTQAERKLAEAEELAKKGDDLEEKDVAKIHLLLDEALADAQLAESKSDSVRAKKSTDTMREAVDALRKDVAKPIK